MLSPSVTIHPMGLTQRAEIELHYECKDGQHDAWLCRLYDASGALVGAGVGDTAALALTDAAKPYECLADHPA